MSQQEVMSQFFSVENFRDFFYMESITGVRSCDVLVIFVPGTDICALQPCKFDDLNIWKNCQSSNRNMDPTDFYVLPFHISYA